MCDQFNEHELAKLLLYLHQNRYLTASQALAYLYLCVSSDQHGRVSLDFRDLIAVLGRKKAETGRSYVRKMARLGLLSGAWQRGSWQAELQLELPWSVIGPVVRSEINRPLMRNQHPTSDTLDPTASAIWGGSVE